MNKIVRHHPDSRLSRAVSHNGLVHIAGTTADNRGADMRGQTTEVLAKIDETLQLAGTDKSKLLSAVVYVSDMRLKSLMDEAWTAWVDAKNPPARATVEARLGTPQTLVEIMAIAAA